MQWFYCMITASQKHGGEILTYQIEEHGKLRGESKGSSTLKRNMLGDRRRVGWGFQWVRRGF